VINAVVRREVNVVRRGTPNARAGGELKIDGLSVSLHYENGILSTGATRGDGRKGDDVSQNVKTIRSIPLRLKKDAPAHAEVRGEVFLSRTQFQRINAELEMQGQKTFANARNSASGTLRMLDSTVVASRRLDMFPYDSFTGNTIWDDIQT